jgi:hypothetical protein
MTTSTAGKIKTLLIILFCVPNLIGTIPPNGDNIGYEILPGLVLGVVSQLFRLLMNKPLNMPSWNDNLFKKGMSLSQWQFLAVMLIAVALCWLLKTAIVYHGLNGQGLIALSLGVGVLTGIYLTVSIARSRMKKSKTL